MVQQFCGTPWEEVRWAALPLGGGIGRTQLVCGAVNGGAMAIGLKLGQRGLSRDGLEKEAREESAELMRRFRDTFGCLDCRSLTGYDFNSSDGYRRWRESGLLETDCVKYVGVVVKYLVE